MTDNRTELRRLIALPGQISKAIERSMRVMGQTQVVDMRRRFGGRPGLIPRSKWLRDSFTYRLDKRSDGELEMQAYTLGTRARTRTGQPYSWLQEFGGTIRPVRGKYLTIPTILNQRSNGSKLYESAADLRSQGKTLLVKTKRGALIVMVKTGPELLPMWVLRSQVTVPPRLRFFASFKDREEGRNAMIAREVGDAIRAN